MRKTLFWLFSMLLFVTLPALAQHNNGGHGGNRGNGGGSQVRNGGERHGGGERQARNDRHNERQVRNNEQRGERHEQRGERHGWFRGGREHRDHWDGRRFDRDYFRGHWGYDHRFYWGRCRWYGGEPFYVGSYFWFNDAYWTIVEPIPYDWYGDEVYVDWVDGYGYVLVDPNYPGVYFRVDVRF